MSTENGDSGNFSFQKRIKIERIKRGLSQEKLGEIIGISKGYVSKIETTNQEPSPAVKKLLQQWLREETSQKHQAPVDIQYEVGENISLPPGVGLPGKNSKLERWHLVPLFGNVPAGFPSQITEPDIISYVAADMDVPKGAGAIRVSGNSMLKPDGEGIKDGDLAFFMEGQQAVHNSVVVVNDEFGDSMLKRLKIQEDGKYWLVSDNPAYPPVQPNCQFRIMGVVVKVRRDVKF